MKKKKKKQHTTEEKNTFPSTRCLILSLAMIDVGKAEPGRGEGRHTASLDRRRRRSPSMKNALFYSSSGSKRNIESGREKKKKKKKISIKKERKVFKVFPGCLKEESSERIADCFEKGTRE